MKTIEDKISVVMPSYLGKYAGAASDRIMKFNRAINSFLNCNYSNKELIIVSDGCEETNKLYDKLYYSFSEIKLIKITKQPIFSGNVRDVGLKNSTGKIICYLDTDDIIGKDHLFFINQQFDINSYDWVYYNDYIKFFHLNHISPTEREVLIERGLIGTSSIAHINNESISWESCDTYGHDWTFVERLKNLFPRYKKINGCSYIVCHIPNSIDH